MKNMTDFEAFAHAYLKHATAEYQKYLLSINGTIITEEITSVDALNEAIEGTLAINPDSEIKVYQITDYDYVGTSETDEDIFAEEVEEVEEEVVETTEEAAEEVETETVPDENPVSEDNTKELPRKGKSAEKAAKEAKKAAKLAKKAAKAERKALKAGQDAVVETEELVPEPTVEKVVEKKTVTKKTTTKKVAGIQAVAKLHKDTKAVIQKYDSISDAAEDSDVHSTNISKVCRGIRGSAGGFGWKYL